MAGPDAGPGMGDYRRLFAAYALSLVGTGIAVVAMTLLAFDLVGDDAGEVIGTALSIKVFAYVVVAPVAAGLTGRVHKRPLLAALGLVRAGTILVLPWVTAPWQLYLVIFVFTASSAAFTPTYQALVPHLLPDEDDYARALAKSRVATELENAVSPLIAAALLLVLSLRGVFVVAVGVFVLSVLLLLGTRMPNLRPMPRAELWTQIAMGPKLLIGTPGLRALIPLNLAVAAATAMVMVNTVVLVQGDLDLDGRATAVAFAVFGGGSVLGALVVPWLLDRVSDRATVLAGCALLVAGLFLGARVGTYPGLLLLWFWIGLGTAVALTPAPFLLPRLARSQYHPVLYAALFSLTNASLLVAYPAAGWLGGLAGLDAAFVVLGLAAAVGTAATAATWPQPKAAAR